MESGIEIKDVVKARYAERARQASSRDTGKICCASTGFYTPRELQTLPETVVAVSAGCGNPAALAAIREGEVVLDLGSGGGIDCFLAGRAVGEVGCVLGVDMTPDMVLLAKKNARRLGASNVEFLLAELESLPLAENRVDVIISNCVINLSPDKDTVFQEAFRVLRPGGRLHVSDILLEQELPEAVRRDPDEWSACVAGPDLKEVYLERVRRAGFAEVTVVGVIPAQQEEPAFPGIVSAKIEAKKALR